MLTNPRTEDVLRLFQPEPPLISQRDRFESDEEFEQWRLSREQDLPEDIVMPEERFDAPREPLRIAIDAPAEPTTESVLQTFEQAGPATQIDFDTATLPRQESVSVGFQAGWWRGGSWVNEPFRLGINLIGEGLEVGEQALADIMNRNREMREGPLWPAPNFPSYDEMTEPQRIFAAGGEILSMGGMVALAPTSAIKYGAIMPQWLRPITDHMLKNPKSFFQLEAGALTGATQLGMMAEAWFPGHQGASTTMQMVGGFLNPVTMSYRAARAGLTGASDFVRSFSNAGMHSRFGALANDLMRKNGEDVQAHIARLQRWETDPELRDLKLTPGQITGSPTLLALERKLAQHSSEWSGIRQRNTEEAMRKMRDTADRLAASGDPQAVRDASIIREHYYDTHLQGILQRLDQEVADIVARLGTGRREEASVAVTNYVRAARKEAEDLSQEIWNKVDKSINVNVQTASRVSSTPDAQWIGSDELTSQAGDAISGLADAHAIVASSMLPEFSMPMGATLSRMLKDGTTTSGELLLLRQQAAAEARRLRRGPQPNLPEARRYSIIAMGAEAELLKTGDSFVRPASNFTKHISEIFGSRTYASQVRPEDAQSAVPDRGDLLLDNLFGSRNPRTLGFGGRVARGRAEDLERVADPVWMEPYLITGGIPASRILDPERGALVRQEFQEFLVSIFNRTIDSNGNLNVTTMGRFLQQYSDVLELFPRLRMDLQDVQSTAIRANNLRDTARQADQLTLDRDAFARFIGHEDASYVIGQVARGAQPEAQYREIAQRARQISEGTYMYQTPGEVDQILVRPAAEGVVAGLRASTIDYAFQSAMTRNSIDWRVFNDALFAPVSRGRPSLAQMMREEGIISETELLGIRQLTQRAMRVQQAEANPEQAQEILGQVDTFWDLAVRALGSRMATNAMGTGQAGPSLIIAGGGARLGRSLLTGTPNSKYIDQMIVLAGSPELTAAALSNTASLPATLQLGRQINAFLISAGLQTYDLDYLEQLQQQEIPEIWD